MDWRALYAGLRKFADDVVEHIHTENNAHFPRFMVGSVQSHEFSQHNNDRRKRAGTVTRLANHRRLPCYETRSRHDCERSRNGAC